MYEQGFETGEKVVLDYVWSAQRFTKGDLCDHVKNDSKVVALKTSVRKLAEAEGF
jgi:hypothetical protein